MITITKEKKDDIFNRNKELIEVIYHLCGSMVMHSQLITLAEEMGGLGTTSTIKKSILELIKGELVKKKQVLNTNNNMLMLTSHPIARIEGIKSGDAYLPQDSTKSVIENILRCEQRIYTLKEFRKQCKVIEPLSVDRVKSIFGRLNSTICVPLKDINGYIESLNKQYGNSLSQDFRDELTALQVVKAQKINGLAKYNTVEIDPEALRIKENLDELKNMYRGCEVQQNFFNLQSIKNSSCDIEQFKIKDGKITARLAIWQTRNGDFERCCEIAAWTYLALKRYNGLSEDPELNVHVYLINEETTERYIEECESFAEYGYGYKNATKAIEKLKQNGVRFPQCTECISFTFTNLHITDHYHISF